MAKVNKKKVALGVGLGLAAAAAAGAGYFFYGSEKAGANRKKVARWSTELEAKVKHSAKKLKKLDQKAYATIVDEATKAYKSINSIDKKDLQQAARELKQNWKSIEKELDRTMKVGQAVAKRTVKKVIAKAKKSAAPKKAKVTVKKVVSKKKA